MDAEYLKGQVARFPFRLSDQLEIYLALDSHAAHEKCVEALRELVKAETALVDAEMNGYEVADEEQVAGALEVAVAALSDLAKAQEGV